MPEKLNWNLDAFQPGRQSSCRVGHHVKYQPTHKKIAKAGSGALHSCGVDQ